MDTTTLNDDQNSCTAESKREEHGEHSSKFRGSRSKREDSLSTRLKKSMSDAEELDNLYKDAQITKLHRAAESGDCEQVEELMKDRHVDVNARDRNGNTPLQRAAKNGYEKVVALLLESTDIDPGIQDGTGKTALHLAAQNGHESVVEKLLSHPEHTSSSCDADAERSTEETTGSTTYRIGINQKDSNLHTPLHLASEKGHLQTVRLLLDRSADPTPKDKWGLTAQQAAAIGCHQEVVDLLKRCSPSVSASENADGAEGNPTSSSQRPVKYGEAIKTCFIVRNSSIRLPVNRDLDLGTIINDYTKLIQMGTNDTSSPQDLQSFYSDIILGRGEEVPESAIVRSNNGTSPIIKDQPDLKCIETRFFHPTTEYVCTSVQNGNVDEYLRSKKDNRSAYMITGLVIARDTSSRIRDKQGLEAGETCEPDVAVDLQGEASQPPPSATSDFIYAFRFKELFYKKSFFGRRCILLQRNCIKGADYHP